MYTSGTTGQPKGALLTIVPCCTPRAPSRPGMASRPPTGFAIVAAAVSHQRPVHRHAHHSSAAAVSSHHTGPASAAAGLVDAWRPTWINALPTIAIC